MASIGMPGTLYRAAAVPYFYRNAITVYRNRLGRPSPGPVIYRLRQGPELLVDPGPHDVRQLNEIWVDQAYGLVPGFMPQPGWVVMDVGANKGLFSAWAAHRMGKGQIVAFEPDLRSITFARANFAQFPGVSLDLRQGAVAGEAGTVALYTTDGATGLTSIYGRMESETGLRVESGRAISAPCFTLTQLLDEWKPDLVKIDVEGAEYEILLPTDAGTLSRVPRLVLEYDLHHPRRGETSHEDLAHHLEKAGLRVSYANGRRLMFATSVPLNDGGKPS